MVILAELITGCETMDVEVGLKAKALVLKSAINMLQMKSEDFD